MKVLLGFCILGMMIAGAGCARPASTLAATWSYPTASSPTGADWTVGVTSVLVRQGTSIEIDGTAHLPPGSCLKTRLMENNLPVDWWPQDACISPDGATWQMVVPLGRKGAPQALNPQAAYEVQAWWPDQPQETLDRLPFDLTPPPAPQEPTQTVSPQ